MSMQDPISDMLTIIRNGLLSRKKSVSIMYSKIKYSICIILLEQGYLNCVNIVDSFIFNIELKYYNGKSVINSLYRVSKPSLRIYKSCRFLSDVKVRGGLGVSVLSTSFGLLTDKQAFLKRIGGEVICSVF